MRRPDPAAARDVTPRAKERRKRVLIIGGGLGALSTAWELTEGPHRIEHEITVLVPGWRLGGKGASGRRMASADRRIEEHGLHVWSGIYDNAFAMVRRCYHELGRSIDQPLSEWTDAFTPASTITLWERDGESWIPWVFENPQNGLHPGDPGTEGLFAVSDLILLAIHFARTGTLPRHDPGASSGDAVPGALVWSRILAVLLSAVGHAFAVITRVRGVGPSARWLVFGPLLWLVRRWLSRRWDATQRRLADAADADARTRARRSWILANFAYGNVAGMIDRGAWWNPEVLAGIDRCDYREWLERYILADGGLTIESPLVKFLYDAEFAFCDGDIEKPSLAAGVALRTLVSMVLGWKGALVWNLQGGMGDVVFAPMYEVLRRRGVRFEFFRRIEQLELDPRVDRIHAVHVAELADLADGRTVYEPLVDVDGLPSWPAEPDWCQLAAASRTPMYEDPSCPALRIAKRFAGVDFDHVVLAAPIRVVQSVAAELVERDPNWRRMVESVASIATQSAQIWTTRSTAELGFAGPGGTLMGAYRATPMSTLGDVSHALARERWPDEAGAPRGLFYACGPMRDGDNPQDTTRNMLVGGDSLLPGAFETGRLDWNILAVPRGVPATDEARIREQYVRANTAPSEQFTLSLPGTIEHRIPPHRTGFVNLSIAGDWTRTGLDISNSEAACLSGRIAARAVLHVGLDDLSMPRVGPFADVEVQRTLPAASRPEWVAAVAVIATLCFGSAVALSLAIPTVAPSKTPIGVGGDASTWAGVADFGYTWSLLMFVLPCAALAVWARYARLSRAQLWAMVRVTGAVFLAGLLMDSVIAGGCFVFPNEHAVVGLWLPGWRMPDAAIAWYPVEELAFYALGGLLMIQLYVFGDATVFSYGVRSGQPRQGSSMRNMTRSRSWKVVMVLAAPWAIKLALSRFDPCVGTDPPIYCTVLVLIGLVPLGLLLDGVYRCVNWRAYLFGFAALLLISLLWEVTLGIPYGYWGYQNRFMLGIQLRPWWNLPFEAVLMWLVASLAVVLAYEKLLQRRAPAAPLGVTPMPVQPPSRRPGPKSA